MTNPERLTLYLLLISALSWGAVEVVFTILERASR